jgi:hypothetical protein
MHSRFRLMKVQILIAAIVLPAITRAQDTAPADPQATPLVQPTPMEDPALPMPGEESGGASSLLPESNAIPEHKQPVSERPEGPRVSRSSNDSEKRLEKAREIAMRNPHAIALFKLAKRASSSKAKHRYLRSYYTAVCERMRKLEPDLKSAIDAYQEQKTGESVVVGSTRTTKHSTVHRSRLHHHHFAQVHRYHHHYRVYDPPEYEDYPPPPPGFYGPPPGWD